MISVFGLARKPTMQRSAANLKGSAASKVINKLLNEKSSCKKLAPRTTCSMAARR